MITRRVLYLLTALILHLNTASAQATLDIKVKKGDPIFREFEYSGKPISPLALINMFPDMDMSTGKDTIDIGKYPFGKAVQHDSIYHSIWKMPYQQKRSYYMEFMFNKNINDYSANSANNESQNTLISYIVLGNTRGGKFIVLAYLKADTLNYDPYIFILDIQGDKLIRLGGFGQDLTSDSFYDTPVLIKGDTIINGTIKYPIPISAR